MSETGEVARDVAIMVLRANGVDVAQQADGPQGTLVLAKGDVVETRPLPDRLGRQLLHYLHRKFDVPIHHFYNPLMAPGVIPSSFASN